MSNLISVVTSSEKRKNLLILLNKGPLFWDDIKIRLNVTASGMLPQIKILEEEGLITKKIKQYNLTDIGRLVVYHLEKFDNTLGVLDKQKNIGENIISKRYHMNFV